MIYLLTAIFIVCCILILLRILKEFQQGYDWFSVLLYALIFLISCSILWILIFGPYYWIIDTI